MDVKHYLFMFAVSLIVTVVLAVPTAKNWDKMDWFCWVELLFTGCSFGFTIYVFTLLTGTP